MHVAGDLAKMRYAASKSISISIIVLVFVTFPVVGDFDSGSEPEWKMGKCGMDGERGGCQVYAVGVLIA